MVKIQAESQKLHHIRPLVTFSYHCLFMCPPQSPRLSYSRAGVIRLIPLRQAGMKQMFMNMRESEAQGG